MFPETDDARTLADERFCLIGRRNEAEDPFRRQKPAVFFYVFRPFDAADERERCTFQRIEQIVGRGDFDVEKDRRGFVVAFRDVLNGDRSVSGVFADDGGDLVEGFVFDPDIASCNAVEIGIVEDDVASVGGDADIAFDRISAEFGAADEAFNGVFLFDEGCAAVSDVFHMRSSSDDEPVKLGQNAVRVFDGFDFIASEIQQKRNVTDGKRGLFRIR